MFDSVPPTVIKIFEKIIQSVFSFCSEYTQVFLQTMNNHNHNNNNNQSQSIKKI